MNLTTRKIYKSEYPFQLRQISQLPKEMDIAGIMPGPENKFLCVVGSRAYSPYGADACEKLISGLRGYPIVIVSGMALGIDSLAHEAALRAGLKTVAFPGSGLSLRALYPHTRRNLALRIIESGGAVVSPFKHDLEAAPWTFPVRNRLMAGISQATLVIEGGHGSGTLLTAGNAAEFSRDVMVVPGSIFSELSFGPHKLLKEGARLVATSEDILDELGFTVTMEGQALLEPSKLQIDDEERRLIELIPSPIERDLLIEKLGCSVLTANMLLAQLELKCLIKENGNVISRIR
jgi:DNA processing protein